MKNLPIGTQSFAKLRNDDSLYVDKTEFIHHLITSGKSFFLSRPRRFGKSLLVSTLEAIFKGEKNLFDGLYISTQWNWSQRYPVIRLDFGAINNKTAEDLLQDMEQVILGIAQNNGIPLMRRGAGSFAELIEKLHQSTGQQVVILVDEYDKPITDNLLNINVANGNRDVLHNFYQVMKATDEHLRFIFLTGVSKFSGVSVFSGLNNLNDITLNEKYTSLCGYTQSELESYFSEYIDDVAQHVEMSKEGLLAAIRTMYDGYSWDGKTSVYNPFSTLLFFENREFANYWFRTGTPTFLVHLLKKRNQITPLLEPVIATSISFESYDPNCIEELPLLFQTGYLTIKNKVRMNGIPEYTLEIPNSEVRESLLSHLFHAYSDYPGDRIYSMVSGMQQNIKNGDVEGLEQNLRLMLSYIPYELHIKAEAYYHSMLLLWIKMLGFEIQGQVMTNIGRIDAVWQLPKQTVVAEIKFHAKKDTDTLLNEAMQQIHDRRYYEPYIDKKVILLAVAFTGKEVKCRTSTTLNPFK
ncbi:ATPase AAA [Bacteroidia bacterium]|nr:ATPase AAA [Bacteroidia bacterium]